jgi:hypothetical protein
MLSPRILRREHRTGEIQRFLHLTSPRFVTAHSQTIFLDDNTNNVITSL